MYVKYIESFGLPKYIEAKVPATCFYLIKGFFKIQKRSGTSLPVLFAA